MARRKLLFGAALLGIMLSAASLLLQQVSHRERSDADYIRLFRDVMKIVKDRYVEPVDDARLIRGAVNGMLSSLDPHSAFLQPEPFHEMQISTSGSFGGLGIEITVSDGRLTVISPIEDTPAYRAGIKAGDHIMKIDDRLTVDMSINQAVKLMRGAPRTSVRLTINRKDFPTPQTFSLVRDIIHVRSVRSRNLGNGIGYVRIAQFQERTGADFADALARLNRDNGGRMKGLVLDLRNNPGGLLDQAVRVAERFVGDNLSNGLIVYTRGRSADSRRDLNARIGEKEPPYPIVVLINGGSASASEIVAGALQDHRRAIIMGSQSFGKGSVQSVIPLRNSAGLLLTTARYYTPGGRSIQAKGIVPDIAVANAELKVKPRPGEPDIREKDLDHHIAGAGDESVRDKKTAGTRTEEDLKNDYQLIRATDLLKSWDIIGKFTYGKKEAAGSKSP